MINSDVGELFESFISEVSGLWMMIWNDVTENMRPWFKYSVGSLMTVLAYIVILIIGPIFFIIMSAHIISESFFIKLGGVKDKVFSSVKWLFYKK